MARTQHHQLTQNFSRALRPSLCRSLPFEATWKRAERPETRTATFQETTRRLPFRLAVGGINHVGQNHVGQARCRICGGVWAPPGEREEGARSLAAANAPLAS